MRKIREFFTQAKWNLLGTIHSAGTSSEVSAATAFCKIVSGRQPRLVTQVHRRWTEWLRLHPRNSVDIAITCSGSFNSTVNLWSLSAKSLGDCKYLPSCGIGLHHQLPLKRNHCLLLWCCREIWNANLHVPRSICHALYKMSISLVQPKTGIQTRITWERKMSKQKSSKINI